MEKKLNRRFYILLASTLAFIIVIFAVALMVGRYPIRIDDFFKAIFTSDESLDMQRSIITKPEERACIHYLRWAQNASKLKSLWRCIELWTFPWNLSNRRSSEYGAAVWIVWWIRREECRFWIPECLLFPNQQCSFKRIY